MILTQIYQPMECIYAHIQANINWIKNYIKATTLSCNQYKDKCSEEQSFTISFWKKILTACIPEYSMRRRYCILKAEKKRKSTTSSYNASDNNNQPRQLNNRRMGMCKTPSQRKQLKSDLKKHMINQNMKDYNF